MQPSGGASTSPHRSPPTLPPLPPPPSPTRPGGEVPPSALSIGIDALVVPGDMTTGEGSGDREPLAAVGGDVVAAAEQELVVVEGSQGEARGAAADEGHRRVAGDEGEEADIAGFLRSSREADRLAQVRLCPILVPSCCVVVC